MIILPESDEDLLRECEVETFRSSGPGGQHVNKTESAVRLTHLPSGVVVTSRQERSQHRNKALCLQRLRKKVAQLNYRPAKRVPTLVSRRAKNRTLEEKQSVHRSSDCARSRLGTSEQGEVLSLGHGIKGDCAVITVANRIYVTQEYAEAFEERFR